MARWPQVQVPVPQPGLLVVHLGMHAGWSYHCGARMLGRAGHGTSWCHEG